MEEIWKDIEGYEGLYQVSNLGRVKSLDRHIRGTNNSLRFHCGRIMSPADNGKGYLSLTLKNNGQEKTVYVHRLVAQHFIPNPNRKSDVNHKDFDKSNNRCDNLEWATRSENERHSLIHGKARQRITAEDVISIRNRKNNGESYNSIFGDYVNKISQSAFLKAYRGYTWKYIGEAK